MNYQQIFGYIATCFSSVFYCSLVIPFLNVLRCKLNYEYTPIIFVDTIYIDSVSWYIYATKIYNKQLILCHTMGACCTGILIVIYLAFQIKQYPQDAILNCLILILGTMVLHKILSVIIDEIPTIGNVCIGTKIITFCIPIYILFKIYKDKTYKQISFNITLTYLACCIAWVLFGKSINDNKIMIANGVGVVVCLVQFVLYLSFKKQFPSQSNTVFNSTSVIEKNIEEPKKDENATITMSIDEEKVDKAKEKPVKIITRIEN